MDAKSFGARIVETTVGFWIVINVFGLLALLTAGVFFRGNSDALESLLFVASVPFLPFLADGPPPPPGSDALSPLSTTYFARLAPWYFALSTLALADQLYAYSCYARSRTGRAFLFSVAPYVLLALVFLILVQR